MKLLLQGQKTPMNAANVQDGDLKKGDYSYGTVQVDVYKRQVVTSSAHKFYLSHGRSRCDRKGYFYYCLFI